MKKAVLSIFVNILFTIYPASCDISVDHRDLFIKLHDRAEFTIDIKNATSATVLELYVQHKDILRLNDSIVNIAQNETKSVTIEIEAVGAGHSEIYVNSSNSAINVKDIFIRVTVYKNSDLDIFSTVIGWTYFAAWSVSFYPQVYINWKRKSVVGLNFDFLVLNIVGFTLYSIFNLGLYSAPEIKNEYFDRHPRGLNPVKVNDIVFAVHATIVTLFTIFQCLIYEREGQKVSVTARIIVASFTAFLTISAILSGFNVIHWLDFLYYCSYVKLTITLIKYMPQAYMNYKRKSTIGWSIGNIFFDFTGGSLSMLQMIVDAYNYDDWVSLFGDPTKFGLGLFSVLFDILFIVQHYFLYRHSNYEER